MTHTAIKNMRLLRPAMQRGNTALDLGDHPGVNDTLGDECLSLSRGQCRQELILLILNPRDIGQ